MFFDRIEYVGGCRRLNFIESTLHISFFGGRKCEIFGIHVDHLNIVDEHPRYGLCRKMTDTIKLVCLVVLFPLTIIALMLRTYDRSKLTLNQGDENSDSSSSAGAAEGVGSGQGSTPVRDVDWHYKHLPNLRLSSQEGIEVGPFSINWCSYQGGSLITDILRELSEGKMVTIKHRQGNANGVLFVAMILSIIDVKVRPSDIASGIKESIGEPGLDLKLAQQYWTAADIQRDSVGRNQELLRNIQSLKK